MRREPIEHDLKTWPQFFRYIWSGEKRFEVRREDRDYSVGDTLLLREWSQSAGYTGRAVRVQVAFVLGGLIPGIEAGHVVMGIDNFVREGAKR